MQHIFIPSLDRKASGSTESGTRERLIMTNHTHKHHSITPSTTQQLAHPSILFLSHRPPIEHLRCTHVLPHFKHTNTCTHPSAHLLSKSRKKCGQFSKSLPRTLMRFPMAGDLDGRKQQNAYSTQNLATRMKIHNMHMENTAGSDCFICFLPICTFLMIPSSSPPPSFCLSNMSRVRHPSHK